VSSRSRLLRLYKTACTGYGECLRYPHAVAFGIANVLQRRALNHALRECVRQIWKDSARALQPAHGTHPCCCLMLAWTERKRWVWREKKVGEWRAPLF
jgi:hypothetical protein